MSVIEKAARALHEALQQERPSREPDDPLEPSIVKQAPFITWDDLPPEAKKHYCDVVRIIMRTIHEPSDAMISKVNQAAWMEFDELYPDFVWRAMIDAALEEG